MRKSFFFFLVLLCVTSCKVKTDKSITVNDIQKELGFDTDNYFYACICQYKDSLFNVVIEKVTLFNIITDSLYYLSDGTAIGSSLITHWNVKNSDPIQLNSEGVMIMKPFSVSESKLKELRTYNLSKFLEENNSFSDINKNRTTYLFPLSNPLSKEWQFLLIENRYKIVLDSETGYFLVFK